MRLHGIAAAPEQGAPGAGFSAGAASLHGAPLPGLPMDVAIGDLDDLLNAIKGRLREAVGEPAVAESGLRQNDVANRTRVSVLECTVALEHLHQTLKHELARRWHLESDLSDAQAALARVRDELARTQAGEMRARHMALHDELTTLPNRSLFRLRMDKALVDADPQRRALSIVYIDLDGFKSVNDAHGHDAGDELLRIVAARLRRAVRADDLVSRFGGDEFACLLVGVPGREHLGRLACKLFQAVSAPLKIGEVRLTVRPSIGIAVCPMDGVTADALLRNADAAMYRAKRQQTGYAFFDQRDLD